jgi:hypothetical protein
MAGLAYDCSDAAMPGVIAKMRGAGLGRVFVTRDGQVDPVTRKVTNPWDSLGSWEAFVAAVRAP